METINVSINGQNENIMKVLLLDVFFGSSYFTNKISNIEQSTIEIEGISCKSIEVFFNFIQNQERFLNQQKFIKEYENVDDQILYEMLIIFDYFNSSLLELVCTILENKPLVDNNSDVVQIELYKHINELYNEKISKRIRPNILKMSITDDGEMFIMSNNIQFLINEPYLESLDKWKNFIENLKNIENGVDFLDFCYLYIHHNLKNRTVRLTCECRGGLGGDGFLETHVSSIDFCEALENLVNSDEFAQIYNF